MDAGAERRGGQRLSGRAKNALKKRLEAEGRWREFVQRREAVKRSLVVAGRDERDAAVQAWSDAAAEFAATAPGGPPQPASDAVARPTAARETAPAVTHPDEEDDADAALWRQLAELVPDNKKAHTRQQVEWVAQHLDVPPGSVNAAAIPNRSALSLLRWARSSASNRDDFFKNIWTKLLPNRSVSDADGRLQDDGRQVIGLIDRVREASLRARRPEVEADIDDLESAAA